MQDIRRFVYFDLEATGLKSSGRPRVCEISLIAVNTSNILDLHKSLLNIISGRIIENTIIQVETCSPRIVNKLTFCVYPMATIVLFVTSMTGLDNDILTGQSKFDRNIGNLLNIFLSYLPTPVCLVAHKGSRYDFPLLKAEREKAGTKLGSQILCVDSYLGIKSILKNSQQISSELA
jgi:three prime repair exonuclease-1